MITKAQKEEIHLRLKQAGVKKLGDVFNLINSVNQGHTDEHEVWQLVESLIQAQEALRKPEFIRQDAPRPYVVKGKSIITANAIEDMNYIMSNPYVIGGALMPDAHRVFTNGMPVGGVVVTEPDWIYPSFVGSDISCSLLLTVFPDMPMDDIWTDQLTKELAYVLRENTYFGRAINPNQGQFASSGLLQYVPEMQSPLGKSVLKSALGSAPTDFATSGDGNHFVEFGYVDDGNTRSLAILSHFGSRYVGAVIGKEYEAYAIQQWETRPKTYDSPLNVQTPEGADYVALMNWAGLFAEYGHHQVHKNLMYALYQRGYRKLDVQQQVYSRHNFAWLTDWGWVHRKGATPTPKDELALIPATMGDRTQVVMGLGNPDVYDSASHGAGRVYSRGQALQQFKGDTAEYVLKHYGVTLIGGGADEHPLAYKKISDVMQYQADCVRPVAEFIPKVVRMADPRIFTKKRK
ncbi:MAG: RtcB family protein [Anaerolineae bacterium]|nr:RtcB family protein [Anaerolineae bacterium]